MLLPALICLSACLKSEAIIDEVQHRAVDFFWNESNPKNGFTKDRASNDAKAPDTYDVASCAAVGFALISYPIGVEHHWLERQKALARTQLTLSHLLTDWENERGWLYHFANWKTGARQWKCEASSIDTGLCLAGVLFAEQYWNDPLVTKYAKAFEKRIDWEWMLTDGGKKPNEVHFSMGWHPESGFIGNRWWDYNESKFLYVEGYGLSDVTNAGWDKIRRPIIHYKGIDLIQGGPIFMHEMSEGFFDFRGKRDRQGFNYDVAERNAALANRQYCIDNPKQFKGYGPDFWGLNACDEKGGYNAFGAPGWINDNGTICPTGPLAAANVIPDEAVSFANHIRHQYPQAWGQYGFPDAMNPSQDWIDKDVIGIDLGMMLCGTENHRTELIWRTTSAHPAVRKGLERVGLVRAPADARLQVPR